ncbi:MAG: hypothetical protein GF387_02135 [Candidatus Portnoybacteria bacterium]|nr:hypothetical protein [Candidatus Portnoybacteria bacterium]
MSIDEIKQLIKEGKFHNPTKGILDLDGVLKELINFKKEDKDSEYKVVIGTDSEVRKEGVEFVCVVAIHRIRKGGRYFWFPIYKKGKMQLRNRIHQEATISLALAGAFLEKELEMHKMKADMNQSINDIFTLMSKNTNNSKEVIFSNNLEIHVDIGTKGPTNAMIKEIVGMIKGSGFFVRIKPEAFAAANLADKHL